jgi:predicted N-acyltransferase
MISLKPLKKIVGKAKRIHEEHRERHRPSGFGFALSDSIDYLDAAQWDAVTSNASVFLSRNYLRALERAGPSNSRQRYALIFRGKQPVAAVSAQAVRVSAGSVPNSKLNRQVASGLGRIEQNILVCGNLLSWGPHGVAFAPGEDPATVWPGVADALYRIRLADRLFGNTDLIMIKDIPHEQVQHTSAMARFSYRALETEPNMVLTISPQWRSFDDYLSALTSSYRKTTRKIHEQVAAAGCSLDRLSDVERHADPIHALYLQVHKRQKMRLVSLTPGFIPSLAATFGNAFRCTVLRRGEEILGFVTTLKDRDTAVGYYIGFDKDANGEIPIYFRLLQAVVEDAIQMGCREVSFGRTALEPKARLGAQPVPLHVWVRHRVPAMNMLVRGLMHTISHEEAPDRSPFKPPTNSA